jgi:TolB-like protein/DNA-binding winged helix-turn-helix (wHTH) protein
VVNANINKNRINMSVTQINDSGLIFDSQTSQLLLDGELIKLDNISTRLLSYFLENPDDILSREQLSKNVWLAHHVSNNAINRSVSVLRKLLGPGNRQYIATISKKGYRYNALPQPADVESTASTDKCSAQPVESLTSGIAQAEHRSNNVKSWLGYFQLKIGLGLVIFLLSISLVWFFYGLSTIDNQSPYQSSDKAEGKTPTIAVLPLVKRGGEQQQYFVDGLREEMINHLTRIPGLVTIDPAMGFSDAAGKTISADKIKKLAAKRGIDYLLQGSVESSGTTVRITAQLIEVASANYLFSTSFNKELINVFDIQTQVSRQIASALKLSLLYTDHHYSSALEKLDHIGVEQLVIARAKLREYSASSIKSAFDMLSVLDRRFPNTPEVMGLLAYVSQKLATTSTPSNNYSREVEVDLAKKTLVMQSDNLDALKTLYYYYVQTPELREQAFAINDSILSLHPGEVSAWRSRLHQMIMSASPCEEMSDYVNSIPNGVFTKHRRSVIHAIVATCLTDIDLETSLDINDAIKKTNNKRAIYNNLYFFEKPHDLLFTAVKERFLKQPKKVVLVDYYWVQLALGATSAAAATAKKIDYSGDDFWSRQLFYYSYLNGIEDTSYSDNFWQFDYLLDNHHDSKYFSAALIHRANNSGNNEQLLPWLNAKPTFAVTLFNRKDVIELIMLQYHAGQHQRAQETAKQLYQLLDGYYQQHRQSYLFWGLATGHFIAQMYCGEACVGLNVAQSPLAQWFKPDHAFWVDDLAFTKLALSPWSEHPKVIEMLERIDKDRLRARKKFGIQ